MAAKIRKNDLVEVVRGRTSDEKALAERNARRAEEGKFIRGWIAPLLV